MRTVDNPASADQGLWNKLGTDLALMRRLAGMMLFYWTKGRRIRAAYRRCEASGETFWVDEASPERGQGST